jgi:hypothetical protein
VIISQNHDASELAIIAFSFGVWALRQDPEGLGCVQNDRFWGETLRLV